jgi:hypothetical protein
MNRVIIPIKMFEAGDRVCTPEGDATVVKDTLDEYVKKNGPDHCWNAGVFVILDEPTSDHTTPGEKVEMDRDNLIMLDEQPGRDDKVPRWNGKDQAFCTKCGTSVKALNEDVDRCPSCGDQSYPCLWKEQYLVSVNLHELHVLCVWAERFINGVKDEQVQASCATILRSIVDRLLAQLPPGTILTLCDDIKAIREHGLDVESDFIDM